MAGSGITFSGERGYYRVYKYGEYIAEIGGSRGEYWINGSGEGRPFLCRIKYGRVSDAKRWCRAVLGKISVETAVRSISSAAPHPVSPGHLESVLGTRRRKRNPSEVDRWMAAWHYEMSWDGAEMRYELPVSIAPSWRPEAFKSKAA